MANVRSSPPGRGAAPGQDGAQAGADEPQNGHAPQQTAGQPSVSMRQLRAVSYAIPEVISTSRT